MQVCFWLKVNDQSLVFSALSPQQAANAASLSLSPGNFKFLQTVLMLALVDYRHGSFLFFLFDFLF